jgi:hypothetical protein
MNIRYNTKPIQLGFHLIIFENGPHGFGRISNSIHRTPIAVGYTRLIYKVDRKCNFQWY